MSVSLSSMSLLALVALSDIAAARSVVAKREFSRPRFGNVPYGSEVISCTKPGVIALTFDDGPGPLTEKIMSTLDAAGAKGTFFVVGKNGADGMTTGDYDGLLQRMHKNGHHIGSHSFTHPNFNEISYDEKIEELTNNEDAFAEILGFIPTYFRPPFTACNGECYQALGDMGYHVTDYDLDTKDWEDGGVSSEYKYASAVKAANPSTDSFIALAHDIQPFTANGFVQFMLDVGAEKGFKFVTLGECLGDPAANWYRDDSGGPAGGKLSDPPKPKPSPTPTTTSKEPETTKEPEPSTTSSDAQPSASAGVHKEESSSTASSSTEVERSTTQISVVESSTVVSGSSSFVTTYTTQSESVVTGAPSSTDSSAEAEESEDSDNAAAMPAPSMANLLAASLAGLAAWMLL